MKFGYARVSTKKKEQDASLQAQIDRLKQEGCDEVCFDRVSGASDKRSELHFLLSKLRPGDTLCVVRLDRLGRRLISLVTLVNELKEKNIAFKCLDQDIDTSTPMGQLIFNLFASFAEMERQIISERVKAGLERSRLNGGGNKKKITPSDMELMVALKDSGRMTVVDICKKFKIGRTCFYMHYNNYMSTANANTQ